MKGSNLASEEALQYASLTCTKSAVLGMNEAFYEINLGAICNGYQLFGYFGGHTTQNAVVKRSHGAVFCVNPKGRLAECEHKAAGLYQ